MNATYTYKTGRNNITFDNGNSKKGTCRPFVRKRPAHIEFADKCLSFIDMILDFFSSARFIVASKAVFAFVALLGFIGIIGGVEAGTMNVGLAIILAAFMVFIEILCFIPSKASK